MKKEFNKFRKHCGLIACLSLISPAIAGEMSFPINGDFELNNSKPVSWETKGNVTLESAKPFMGKGALKLQCGSKKLVPTEAESKRFDARAGAWEITGAAKSDLFNQDPSFNATLYFNSYDDSGKLISRQDFQVLQGKSRWKKFIKYAECPENTKKISIFVKFNKTHGTAWLDNIQAKFVGKAPEPVGGERRAVFSTKYIGNMFYPEDDVSIHLEMETPKNLPEEKLTFRWELRDYWGGRLFTPSKATLSSGKKGKKDYKYVSDISLKHLPLKTGPYYELHTFIDLGAKEIAHDKMSFAIVSESSTKGYDPMDVPFGSHTWDARPFEYFSLSSRIGARRCLVFWGWPATAPYDPNVERNKWVYNWSLGHPKRFGLKPWLDIGPMHSIEHGKKKYSDEALVTGLRNTLTKYKGKGIWAFSLGNEPPFWDKKLIKNDVRTYKLMYEEGKKIDPSIVAMSTALIGGDEDFAKEGFFDYMDIYNIHWYADLDGMRSKMKKFRRLMKKHGREVPIWTTEMGSKSQGLTRHEVAKDLMHKTFSFFAEGGEFFTWFATGGMSDKDGKRTGSYADSMDLFAAKYGMHLPRLDAIAYYHVIDAMCIKKFINETDYQDGTKSILFRDKFDNNLMVLWNLETQRDHYIELPEIYKVKLTRLDGSGSRLNANGKGVNIRVSSDPILLRFSGEGYSLPKQLKDAQITVSQKPNLIPKGEQGTIVIRVYKEISSAPIMSGPALWDIKLVKTEQVGGGKNYQYSFIVPDDCPATEATFSVVTSGKRQSGNSALSFRIPIIGKLSVDLLPQTLEEETVKMSLVLNNHSSKEQTVDWNIKLIEQIPMESGGYEFAYASSPTAKAAGNNTGTIKLDPKAQRIIQVPLTGIDPLAIYRIRAAATEQDKTTVERKRLIGGFAGVARTKSPVEIDGDLSDPQWEKAQVLKLNTNKQYLATQKGSIWKGEDDLSAKARLLWDENYLYIGVEVKDDVFANPGKNEFIWNQDGLQFLFDPYRQLPESKGRYDYSMGLGQKGHQAWCHLSADPKAPGGEAKEIKIITNSSNNGRGDITYEIAIPWKRLAPFEPSAGKNLGMAMIINEDDGKGRCGLIGWFSGVHSKLVDHVGDLILLP